MWKRLFELVVSILFFVACWLRKQISWAMGKKLPGTCVVLLYHAETSKDHDRFKKQMDILSSFAKPIAANNRESLKRGVHYVVVTFDDGFKGVIENAIPVLIKRKIPSTIFVPTSYLGKHPDWVHDETCQDRFEVVMTANQIRTLNDELVTIGSHGVRHFSLTDLSEEEAMNEIYLSKQELEAIVDRPIQLFAFPHGAYNKALVEKAVKAGYKRVFTIFPILAFSDPEEYITGRINVFPDEWHLEFKLKLLGAYSWLPVAYFLKREIFHIHESISKFLGGNRLSKR